MSQKQQDPLDLGRLEYLQALVTEFQVTESPEAKEQVLANLANFAYDPKNYEYLRQLQVLDLFLDMLTEDNETLVEFAVVARAVLTCGGRGIICGKDSLRLIENRLFKRTEDLHPSMIVSQEKVPFQRIP
ncbi:armadillo repeat-containing protein 7 isoform X2 [Pelodiscus sinensis]|uniref:armadillo repeat-containing protein 7 isoform X2 n=1 Tax=Pelodiscus sinensis TaxID=13735 RepID=UPI003F6D47A8